MADIKTRVKVQTAFTIPARLVEDMGGYEEVVFEELSANDEMAATKRCGNDGLRLGWELAREGLRWARKAGEKELERISTQDATVDIFWNGVGPTGRALLMAAFSQVHSAKPEDVSDFLKSRAVRVG